MINEDPHAPFEVIDENDINSAVTLIPRNVLQHIIIQLSNNDPNFREKILSIVKKYGGPEGYRLLPSAGVIEFTLKSMCKTLKKKLDSINRYKEYEDCKFWLMDPWNVSDGDLDVTQCQQIFTNAKLLASNAVKGALQYNKTEDALAVLEKITSVLKGNFCSGRYLL